MTRGQRHVHSIVWGVLLPLFALLLTLALVRRARTQAVFDGASAPSSDAIGERP
jgi:hypothetical protein